MKAVGFLALSFCVMLPAAEAQKKPKDVKVAIHPDQAGPDWAIQGEYFGETPAQTKLGAEVVARGNGNFLVNFLPSGLRGEGGDYAKHVAAQAKTEDGKVLAASKDGKWTATIAQGTIIGKTADGQSFVLQKIIRQSKTLGMKPPNGAVVLFNGTNADEWNKGQIVDGNLLGNGTVSKKKFGDFTLHLEFRLSFMPFGTGQGRSNSGVYLQHKHEIQVLDSFGLKGANNECGGLYGYKPPAVNMCFPPLTWQTYDVEFAAARYDESGKKTADASVSVRHNGLQIHDKVALKSAETSKERIATGPLHLQAHGGQVQYRNIWVVEK